MVRSTATLMGAPPVVPLAALVPLTVSQFPVLEAVAVNATCELLEAVTERFCAGGEEPFTELKVREGGEACRLNGAGLTVRFTVTGTGELEADVKTLTVPE